MDAYPLDDVLDNIPGTEIRPSRVHGMGLFALAAFEEGQTLCELDGQRVPWALYMRRRGASGEWNAVAGDILIVRPFRTRYSYINHHRAPNLQVLQDPLRVVTLRDIPPGEELLLDYRAEPLPEAYMALHGSSYL